MGTAPLRSSSAFSSSKTPSRASNSSVSTDKDRPNDSALLGVLRDSLATGGRDTDPILHAIAHTARVLSGADGAAVALRAKAGIVCSARSGNIAPGLGTPLNANAGISGECFRTGKTLVCHDSFSDPRVDPEVCRALGIRSIAVVPLQSRIGIAGILEAFSVRPNAFDGDALRCLRELADLAQSAEPRSTEPSSTDRRSTEHGRQRAQAAPSIPAMPARAASPVFAQSTVVGQSVVVDETENQPRSSLSRMWVLAGIALAILLTSAVAWWSWSESATETEVSAASRLEVPSDPTSARSAPHVVAAKPGPGLAKAGAMGMRTARSKHGTPVQNAAEIQPAEVIAGVASSASSPSSMSPSLDNKTRASAGKSVADTEVEPPPNVNIASAGTPNALAGITLASAPMPTFIPRISKGVSEPKLIRKVDPIYPPQARTNRLTGNVTLEATIAADGSIGDVSVVSGPVILANAATTALRQWRYRPATLNGEPIATQKQIKFVFTLP